MRIARLVVAFFLAAYSGTAFAGGPPPSLFVEGYTNRLSYVPGEEVAFHISTSAKQFEVEIARVGAEREVVWTKDKVEGAAHPIPENASSHGCGWPVSFQMPIPADWKSGYYSVVLRVSDRGGKFVHRNPRTAEGGLFFVVRSAAPGRDAKILIQLATNTYNAYNNWGGSSLYIGQGRAKLQGHRVSFHRPQMPTVREGKLRWFFAKWEEPFVAWAESKGYRLDYAVNSDLEFHPEILEHYRLVLSVGHDEYWSAPMRDNLETFIGKGGNVAFFSGNSVCWQVRSEDDGAALVCWKQWYNQDPVYASGDHRLLTSLWSHHLVGRPENTLTGVGFLHGGYHKSHGQFMDGSGAFTVHRPEHWLFEGTGMENGGTFGAKDTIVGYECDGCEIQMVDGKPEPTRRDGTPKNFVIVATAPARWHPADCKWYERWEKGRIGAAVMGSYTRGGIVVTVGTTDWPHGLRGADPVVERITRNVLDRLGR
jgi:hypothetical protein